MSLFRDLRPELQPYARWLYYVAEYNGLRPRVTSTYRSLSEQQRLYDRYRAGNSVLPAAPPGRSLHNYGLAFDMVVAQHRDWLGSVWNSVGGRWGGYSDPVHFDTGWG